MPLYNVIAQTPKKKATEEIRNIRNEFVKEFPDPNTRTSPLNYVKWLENKIIELRKNMDND